MKNLENFLETIFYIEKNNGKYYKLDDLAHAFERISDVEIQTGEIISTPFYICDLGIMELYDYELNIRVVDVPSADQFILLKTGNKSLSDVNPVVEQKLRKCYLEIINPKKSLPVKKIIHYLEYIRTSIEIQDRITSNVHKYNKENLFFEFY